MLIFDDPAWVFNILASLFIVMGYKNCFVFLRVLIGKEELEIKDDGLRYKEGFGFLDKSVWLNKEKIDAIELINEPKLEWGNVVFFQTPYLISFKKRKKSVAFGKQISQEEAFQIAKELEKYSYADKFVDKGLGYVSNSPNN